MEKQSKSLWGATRQFRHNNSDGFVMGYDIDFVSKLVARLESENEALRNQVGDLQSDVERLTEKLEDALHEIAENHSTEDEEVDGIVCFVVNCNCSFCEDFRKKRKAVSEMPCDYSKYPDDWNNIRRKILKRADGECELCGARNYEPHWKTDSKVILTIAHINQDIQDNREFNLLALCQRCHNKIDSPYRVDNRKETARKNNRAPLFEEKKGGRDEF